MSSVLPFYNWWSQRHIWRNVLLICFLWLESWELSAVDHVHPVWISQILYRIFSNIGGDLIFFQRPSSYPCYYWRCAFVISMLFYGLRMPNSAYIQTNCQSETGLSITVVTSSRSTKCTVWPVYQYCDLWMADGSWTWILSGKHGINWRQGNFSWD